MLLWAKGVFSPCRGTTLSTLSGAGRGGGLYGRLRYSPRKRSSVCSG